MIRMMIADDEIFARNDMINYIDWQKYGIEIVGVASDGIEAYGMIWDLQPDIVLIDIKMPGLSGIDVIRKISQENNSSPNFIIVSGYDDFSYAQQAIELDVDQYLLKPFLPTQLLKAIHRSIEKLELVKRRSVPGVFQIFDLWQNNSEDFHLSYPSAEEENVIQALQNDATAKEISGLVEVFWTQAKTTNPSIGALLSCGLLLSMAIIRLLLDRGVSPIIDPFSSADWIQGNEEDRFLDCLQQLLIFAQEQLRATYQDISDPVQRAVAYIDNHYQNRLNLDTVAGAVYVSSSYLSARFSQVMGIGFVEYVHTVRIQHAKDLLLTTQLKNHQIAERVGYPDHKYFAQVFKKMTTMTPSEYRESVNQSGQSNSECE